MIAFKIKGKTEVREFPELQSSLIEGAGRYIDIYQDRVSFGFGVENGRVQPLWENPDWINDLKGKNSPLKNTGKMIRSVRVNTSKSSKNSVTIDFNDNPRGFRNDETNASIASLMQFGGTRSNVTISEYSNIGDKNVMNKHNLWPIYKTNPDRLEFTELSIQDRPHFFTAEDDRPIIAEPVFREIRNWMKDGALK